MGKFLSGPEKPEEPVAQAETLPESADVEPAAAPRPKVKTKIGRPLGKTTVAREKVSLYVSAALIEEFRARTWAEQCQLGELVERAMAEYAKRWK